MCYTLNTLKETQMFQEPVEIGNGVCILKFKFTKMILS